MLNKVSRLIEDEDKEQEALPTQVDKAGAVVFDGFASDSLYLKHLSRLPETAL